MPKTNGDEIQIIPPASRWQHYHAESEEERERRYAKLFKELDVNNDGIICMADLTEALRSMGLRHPQAAKKILSRSDSNKDGKLDMLELVDYLTKHEKNLHLYFSLLDSKKDGLIDLEEIIASFGDLGVDLDREEAEVLLKRMDADKTNLISWDEFRNFLLLRPVTDMNDILLSWRHFSLIDIGEDITVPDDFTEEELKTGMWWRTLLAGGAAGAVSRTCTAPLDRLKVLLQVHGSTKNNLSITSGLKDLLSEGGVKGLWRGNGVNVIKIAPETAMKFMAYEQMKGLIKMVKGSEKITPIDRFIAGSSAGAIAQTVIYPLEVLKTRLALRFTGQYTGMFDCACKLYRTEGVSVFYRGYIPNLIGIIPYAGIDLMIYETLKTYYLSKHPEKSEPDVKALLICGTTSSTCGQLASYPLALIRTRMQAKPDKHQNMFAVGKSILQDDGVRGLYRGLLPNFLKVAPAVSISYVVYEHVRKRLVGENIGSTT
ncbi:mitochondrial adenyl nucleotide antiporter SLC25A24-like [Watersipora subatra]|uniref:mitochondrial adenyl nucleotide antiporter SLC25A24-like n=1 Tax=Watersipora subatra TaxID=2589382 RepID=UPI00355C33FF